MWLFHMSFKSSFQNDRSNMAFLLYIFKVFLCAGHGHLYIEFTKLILIKKYLYNSVIVINK